MPTLLGVAAQPIVEGSAHTMHRRNSFPGRMIILWMIGALVVIVLVAGLLSGRTTPDRAAVVINGTPVPPVPTLNPVRVERGASLYAQYCATCHGVNREGRPDWKIPLADGSYLPPPQDNTGHTWHHSDALLINIIAKGGDTSRHSKMPAFDGQMTAEEIEAILDFIKSRWGAEEREFQWWITTTQPSPPK